jgi:predicted nucleic acid-binding protein
VTVFVDTSAFFALVDAADDNHGAAKAAFERIGAAEELVTHQYVAVETIALAQRRLDARAMRALLTELFPFVARIAVDDATHEAAVAALLAALPTRVSFVDFVSFQIMRERSIQRAFTFDTDFEKAGFRRIG